MIKVLNTQKMILLSFILLLFLIVVFYFINGANNSDYIKTLLPPISEISPWKSDGDHHVFKKNELFEHINGGADVFLEYGFKQVIVQEYSHKNNSIMAEIYEMDDSIAAFGIFSLNRDYQYPTVNIKNDGVQFDYHIGFWKSRYYVIVLSNSDDKETVATLLEFSKIISKRITGSSETAKILEYLPQNGIIPGSEGNVKGLIGQNGKLYLTSKNLLGIGLSGTEGAFAKYTVGNEKSSFFLVHYPESGQTKKAQIAVTKVFTEDYKQAKDDRTTLFTDRKNRYYATQANGSFLYIVYRADSETMANFILKQTKQLEFVK